MNRRDLLLGAVAAAVAPAVAKAAPASGGVVKAGRRYIVGERPLAFVNVTNPGAGFGSAPTITITSLADATRR